MRQQSKEWAMSIHHEAVRDTMIPLPALRSMHADDPLYCMHLQICQSGELTFCNAPTQVTCWSCDRPVCMLHAMQGCGQRGDDEPSVLCSVCATLSHAQRVALQQMRLTMNS